MFKLPIDIENEIIRKYPDVDVINLFHDLTTIAIQKTCFDGSCNIRDFGKFIAYKIYSTRTGKDVVRFKFKLSTSFVNRLKNDKYLLEKLAIKIAVPFTEKNKQKCADKQDKKRYINTRIPEIQKYTDEKTNHRIATQEILKILETPNEEV